MNVKFERLGFRIQPVHYYSETPSRRELTGREESWARPLPLHGIEWELDRQLEWLEKVVRPHIGEVEGLKHYRELTEGEFGPGYGPIESLVLHSAVRTLAPRRVIEVGSGLSTMVTVRAANMNRDEGRAGCEITCIEPFPRPRLLQSASVRLLQMPAQAVPDDVFLELAEGDILFIDSSHAVKTGSELVRLYLEILPTLRKGVVIHIHDICLPYPYTPDILTGLFDWQETTLLAALLTGNRSLEVLASMSALHHERKRELEGLFRDYRPRDLPNGLGQGGVGHFPSSTWLAVV